jgi:hypothetical protein
VDRVPSYAQLGVVDELADAATTPHSDRYAGFIRFLGAAVSGMVFGVLFINSIEVGVAFALEGHNPEDWTILFWGQHWVWRTVASLVATGAAAFLAGMIARRRGQLVGVVSALPTAAYWAFIAYVGWTGHTLASGAPADIPLGYRIVAVLLALGTLPCAAMCGKEGSAYGHANAEHFDSRRGTLLGVRWYQFVWLPFLAHFMVLTAAFGTIHGWLWMVAAWKNVLSLFGIVPILFYLAMLWTLQLLGTGAWRTYEVLAGFNECSRARALGRVLKFGFGYSIATALAQSAITALQFGLGALLRKV